MDTLTHIAAPQEVQVRVTPLAGQAGRAITALAQAEAFDARATELSRTLDDQRATLAQDPYALADLLSEPGPARLTYHGERKIVQGEIITSHAEAVAARASAKATTIGRLIAAGAIKINRPV